MHGRSYGDYAADMQDEAEIFPSEVDACKFADQLKAAFQFLKCSRLDKYIKVEENQSKMAEMPV